MYVCTVFVFVCMIFKLHSSIGSMYAYLSALLYFMYVFNYEPYIFTLIFISSFYVFTYVPTYGELDRLPEEFKTLYVCVVVQKGLR